MASLILCQERFGSTRHNLQEHIPNMHIIHNWKRKWKVQPSQTEATACTGMAGAPCSSRPLFYKMGALFLHFSKALFLAEVHSAILLIKRTVTLPRSKFTWHKNVALNVILISEVNVVTLHTPRHSCIIFLKYWKISVSGYLSSQALPECIFIMLESKESFSFSLGEKY